MGGVVNVIHATVAGQDWRGTARLGGGSYGTSDFSGRVGGSASSHVDFDLGGAMFDQRDDYRMGNGEVRPRPATERTTGRPEWVRTWDAGVSMCVAMPIEGATS